MQHSIAQMQWHDALCETNLVQKMKRKLKRNEEQTGKDKPEAAAHTRKRVCLKGLG